MRKGQKQGQGDSIQDRQEGQTEPLEEPDWPPVLGPSTPALLVSLKDGGCGISLAPSEPGTF